jgi:hypothetical protein
MECRGPYYQWSLQLEDLPGRSGDYMVDLLNIVGLYRTGRLKKPETHDAGRSGGAVSGRHLMGPAGCQVPCTQSALHP